MLQLIEVVNSAFGTVEYEPYSMADIVTSIGIPPMALIGVNSVRAYRDFPKAKLFHCLAQGGVHVSNRNLNGFVEIVTAVNSPASAALQVVDITGIDFPLSSSDSKALLSFAKCTRARVVNTPEWRKALSPGFTVYTLSCINLAISGGVRKRVSN